MIASAPSSTFTAVLQGAAPGVVPGIRIERSDGTNHTARTTAGIVELEAGSGTYAKSDLVAPDTRGTYVVLWDVGGVFASEELVVGYDLPGSPPGFPGYPTREDLVATSVSDELAALDADQQDALRAAAIASVEVYCGQAFVPDGTTGAPVAHRVSGMDTDAVWLPKRLEALTAITVSGAALNLVDVSLSAEGDRLELLSPLDNGSWVTRVRGQPGEGIVFPGGVGNIVISGAWGWAACPDAVATALRYDMEDQAAAEANALAGTVRSARALGVTNVNQGGLSVSLNDEEPQLSMRAQRVLARHRWENPAGAVV